MSVKVLGNKLGLSKKFIKHRSCSETYKIYLGKNGHLFKVDGVKNKISGLKHLNSSAKDKAKGEATTLTIEAKKIDNVFDKSFAASGNRLNDIRNNAKGELGLGIDEPLSNGMVAAGISRLFLNLFHCSMYPGTNELSNVEKLNEKGPDIRGSGGSKSSFSNLEIAKLYKMFSDPLSYRAKESSESDKTSETEGGARFGSILGFEGHQRLLISFQWITGLLKNTISLNASTTSSGNLVLKMYSKQIEGVIDGLLDAIGETKISSR